MKLRMKLITNDLVRYNSDHESCLAELSNREKRPFALRSPQEARR